MLSLSKPVACLAPMDGITDSAYRQIVRKLNPEVVLFSEFTSVNGIEHSEEVRKRLKFDSDELPYIIQIFGNDPALFAANLNKFEDSGVTAIDINMGCPAKKIIKAACGAALLKNKDLACRIVETCRENTSLPVTVKTRLGWSDAEGLTDFVKGLESAGADMVSVHGRTYSQKFTGSADWDKIYEVKKQVSIPIIGNGDLKSHEQGLAKLKNLDGYMIGRASIGDPWVFQPAEQKELVSFKDKISIMIEHFQLLRKYKRESLALIEFRKHIKGYVKGFSGAKPARSLLMSSMSETEFIQNALSLT